ncbi:MAG TPA: family 78 glycoside hydrolase catalytic domain [Candidatus Polarisedimenticolia bacterium]|nr:family 78 glycoside hydrolase catalytic domain [Candidatus Polarisedimenticolia bacterium]
MKHFLYGFLLTLALAATTRALTPIDLRCDYAVNPLGVDSPNPRLFWNFAGDERGQKQTAYEILAASTENNLSRDDGDLWDSGKVDSDESIQIPYAGKPLNSSEQVFWKIRVWDANGNISDWSKTATWTMGLLNDTDWRAKWIGASDTNIPSLLLRHEFTVKAGLKRALVDICGLGQYELTLNGKKVGDDFLSPGWTKYNKTCLYDTRDITANLQEGKNAVGIELGNGMYNVPGGGRFTKFKGSFGPQKAIAQIRLEYSDGSVETIGTDENWRAAPGPITFSSIYGGEDFDARRVQSGWNQTGFDDSKWPAAQLTEGPGGELRGLSCAAPPIHQFEIHRAISHHTLTNGDIVFDLGQNAAHIPAIAVTGPAGSKIRLIPSELLDRNGAANQGSMGAGHRGTVWCEFTKGTGRGETWSPKFFYVGCRYVQVHLTPATVNGPLPKIKSLAGIVIQSSSEPVGDFECSNKLFNRIRELVRWAQRSNMESIMTDCPHRERLGWLEQDHLNGPALRYEFDLAQLFTKTVNDISDSQLTNGLVPTTAPEYTIFRSKGDTNHPRNAFGDSPEWSSAFILIPWQQYEFDGDLHLFRAHYDAMKEYLNYFGSRADNYIADFGLGDWYDIGPKKPGVSQLTPIALTATAFYYEDTKIMAEAAALLGREEDARNYSALAGKIRAAFNEKFYDSTNHWYASDSQCANAIPLVMGICEPTNRAAVVDAIVRDVRSRGNGLTAGDVGYRYLLRALADGGRSDVVFDMNNQTNKPGYGMQLAKGKTSLTEAWDGGSSQDHFMLGQIEEWFYHDLAGIQNAPGSAGFKSIVINPQPVGNVIWVKASYDSIRGKIVSNWKRDDKTFTLNVTIPPNTTATVFVPAKSADAVTEDGKAGTTFLRMENGRAVIAIQSGAYELRSRL